MTIRSAVIMKPRAALVDDHPIVLESLRLQLRAGGWEIAGEAASYAAGLALLADPTIALAIVDWRLPGGSGAKLVQFARALRPELRCLIFTAHPSRGLVQLAFDVGAVGVICKTTPTRELLSIARNAINGAGWQLGGTAAEMREGVTIDALECRLLRGLAEGTPAGALAEELEMRPSSVRAFLRYLRERHALRRPIDVVSTARRLGCMSDQDQLDSLR